MLQVRSASSPPRVKWASKLVAVPRIRIDVKDTAAHNWSLGGRPSHKSAVIKKAVLMQNTTSMFAYYDDLSLTPLSQTINLEPDTSSPQ